MAENAAIELTGTRQVSFKDRGQTFTYHFRQIEAADWKRFFSGLIIESERVGKQRVDRIDFRNASLQLVDAAISAVYGYKTADGRPLAEWANWKERLPMGHRLKAAELLQDVRVSDAPREFVIAPDVDEVVLRSAWGTSAEGTMDFYDGLVHRFIPPSAEDQRRYNRATSEARVVGGGRTGRTIYPGKQTLLAELYDRLIVEVDGYTVRGEPLGSDTEKIRAAMDTLHKVAAVQELFVTPDDESDEAA